MGSIDLVRDEEFYQEFPLGSGYETAEEKGLTYRMRFWGKDGKPVAQQTAHAENRIIAFHMSVEKANRIHDMSPILYDVHALWPNGGYSFVAKGPVT